MNCADRGYAEQVGQDKHAGGALDHQAAQEEEEPPPANNPHISREQPGKHCNIACRLILVRQRRSVVRTSGVSSLPANYRYISLAQHTFSRDFAADYLFVLHKLS